MSELVEGVESLHRGLGRLFLVIGVFDGLHRGHLAVVERLVAEARRLAARPGVITFDAHPDAVLVGAAPPLLLDPDERLERLERAGVEVTVVQPFDDAVRRTPYDTFIRSIAARVDLAGFLMTPDSAFGHQRRGTPEAVAALGEELGYEVVVAPQVEVDGRPISSSDIRARIAAGDLAGAAELLGRPYAIVGSVDAAGRITTPVPVAVPPPGGYRIRIGDSHDAELEVADDGELFLAGVRPGRRRLEFGAP
jgi:riboflavin kinase/FMN adenylyltransferase